MSTIKEIRIASGMTQQAFSDYLEIPKRTIENWESGTNKCPEYVVKLIRDKMQSRRHQLVERLLKDGVNLALVNKMTVQEMEKAASYDDYDDYNDYLTHLAHVYDI